MGDITNDTPLRLAAAAEIAFPFGGMTAASLRREAARGRLAIMRIGNKDWTTLQAIEDMKRRCHVKPKALGSTSSQPVETTPAASPAPLDGSSETGAKCTPQDALQAMLQGLIKPSPITSGPPTGRRGRNVVSLTSRSQTC